MARQGGKKKKGISWRGQLLSAIGLLVALIFKPTTILLAIGMVPTLVAAVIDRTGRGTRALTVGAMNLAGCSPFLIKLWTVDHSSDMALRMVTDPQVITIMYAGAGIGYLIDWAMTGIVGSLLVQRSDVRLKENAERKRALVERWGEEVTGDIPLDSYGFPIESGESNSRGGRRT